MIQDEPGTKTFGAHKITQKINLPYASLHYTYNRHHSNHSTKVSGWWVMV